MRALARVADAQREPRTACNGSHAVRPQRERKRESAARNANLPRPGIIIIVDVTRAGICARVQRQPSSSSPSPPSSPLSSLSSATSARRFTKPYVCLCICTSVGTMKCSHKKTTSRMCALHTHTSPHTHTRARVKRRQHIAYSARDRKDYVCVCLCEHAHIGKYLRLLTHPDGEDVMKNSRASSL